MGSEFDGAMEEEEKKTWATCWGGTLSCQGGPGHWPSRGPKGSKEDLVGLRRKRQGAEGECDPTSHCEGYLLPLLSPQLPLTERTRQGSWGERAVFWAGL